MKNLILLFTLFLSLSQIGYSQPGEVDTSFIPNGIVKSDLGAKFEYVYVQKQVLEQPDGSMYVMLEQDGQTLMTKIGKDGKTDLNFGTNGISAL